MDPVTKITALWIVAGVLFGGGWCVGAAIASQRGQRSLEQLQEFHDGVLEEAIANAFDHGQRIGELALRQRQIQAGGEATSDEKHVAIQRRVGSQGLQ